jgi:hypothetical protein
MSARAPRAATADLAGAVEDLEQIFEHLEPLAAGFAAIVAGLSARGVPVTRDALGELRPAMLAVMDAHPGSATGAGVITVPGLLADEPRWLEWWWTGSAGPPEALRVNLDESASDFFDYTAADWYAVPMQRTTRHAAGPYVDYFCTNEYTITFALPVKAAGRPIGVAAADVLVPSLERRLVPILRAIGDGAVLTNADGRVIASASPRCAPGERVLTNRAAGVAVPRTRRTRVGTLDWRLFTT